LKAYNEDLNDYNKWKDLPYRSEFLVKMINKYLKRTLTAASITLALWTSAAFSSCEEEEPIQTAINNPDTINKKPTITVYKPEVDISIPKILSADKNNVFIWDELVASWHDDKTDSCSVNFILINNFVYPWDTINRQGIFSIIVSDEKWETNSADIHLKKGS